MSFSFVFPLVGGSGGGGTVSSVGLSMPTNDFNIANSPVTGSDTITVTYKPQIQNLIFGSPDGITGTPLFRYLVGADLPSATTSVKGALPIATDAEALAGSITDKTVVPETLSYTFLNRQIGAITAINSAILATDTINGAFAKTQGQIDAKQNTLTIGNITGSEFSITGGVGAVIGTGVSLSLAASGVTANTYGSSTVVPVLTVNSKGIITGVTNTSIAFPPSSVTSVFGRTGAVVSQSGDYTFAQIGSTPTTLAGYGITDAIASGGSGSVSDISITGLAGSGFLNLRYQSSTPVGLANYGTLYADSIGNIGYKKNANSFTNSLYFSGTADRVYTLQDRSGTLADNFDLATKLDLSGGNANQDIDIGNFALNARHVKINGTGGAGHIGLKHQSADITATGSESSIGADIVGDPVWKNDGGPIDKLELQSRKDSTGGYVGLTLLKINFKNVLNTFTSFFTNSNTASRTYTFQNRDGIIADDTDLAIANNQVAVETWSTNANYTTLNTTAKRLIILQTGTLTLPRTITLTNPSLSGQEVVIVASGSVTSTNYIRVACSFKINVILNTFDIVSPYTQTFLTATNNTGNWTTGQASTQFVETVTALTASKTVRGDAISGGSSSSYTAPFTSPVRGDLKYNTNGGLMVSGTYANEILAPYDPINGWMDYRPSGRNIKYWNQLDISSGNKPIEYSTNFGLAYYWGQTYKVILRGEGTDEYCEYTVYIDLSGVPSIQKTHKSSATLTMAIVSGGLRVTGPNCYAYIYKQGRLTALENPDLNQSFSNDGLINYWSGSLGVGHSSQNASAIGQFDSTTKGFLPPRMTNAQRTAIASPAIGLMVYCTDATEGLWINKSTGWTFII